MEHLDNSIDNTTEQDSTFKGTDLLAGRYRILTEIGSGGMGYVLKAEDTLLNNKIVAIKTLYKETYHDEDFIQNFKNEVNILQCLSHPNLVRVYDIFSVRDSLFYTMEFVNGQDLLKYVTKNKLNIHDFTDLIIQVCKGLENIHDNGLIHRDLKPENILVDNKGVIKIADFGLAKPYSSGDTISRNIAGTTNYMSPEMCVGSELSNKSDLYTLGIIIYELISLRTPFDHDSDNIVFYKHVHETQNSLKDIIEEVPDWLSDLVDSLLQKDPNLRPTNAREVIRTIRANLYGEQFEADSSSSNTAERFDTNVFEMENKTLLSSLTKRKKDKAQNVASKTEKNSSKKSFNLSSLLFPFFTTLVFLVAAFYVSIMTKIVKDQDFIEKISSFTVQDLFKNTKPVQGQLNVRMPEFSDNKTAIRLAEKPKITWAQKGNELYLKNLKVYVKNFGKSNAENIEVRVTNNKEFSVVLSGPNKISTHSLAEFKLKQEVKVDRKYKLFTEIECSNCLDVKF